MPPHAQEREGRVTHPDLNVNTAGAKNCSTDTSAKDGNGHGTHVCGTIGALDNGIGVVGMAPSMATPHVSGAAALYKATHPSASPATVKSALQATATLNWSTATDPDGNADRLLNVAGF